MSELASCKHEAGIFTPVINRNRCEGKADCVDVCPFSVFAIKTLPIENRTDLNFIGKIKGFSHGWQQAALINPNACEACGLCIKACPENAITLMRN